MFSCECFSQQGHVYLWGTDWGVRRVASPTYSGLVSEWLVWSSEAKSHAARAGWWMGLPGCECHGCCCLCVLPSAQPACPSEPSLSLLHPSYALHWEQMRKSLVTLLSSRCLKEIMLEFLTSCFPLILSIRSFISWFECFSKCFWTFVFALSKTFSTLASQRCCGTPLALKSMLRWVWLKWHVCGDCMRPVDYDFHRPPLD